MCRDFIVFSIGKIIIIRNGNQKNYYKEVNNELCNLSDQELIYINSVFNQENGYLYNTEKLTKLLSENSNIENKQYVMMFFDFLEKIIPENCRDNFYRNIENLNIYKAESKESDNFYSKCGGYNTQQNSLTIEMSYLKKTWEIAQKSNNPEDFYVKQVNLTLLHELTHMASSNYNQDTSISLCGFDKYPSDIEEDKNRGLTEGMTEVIAMAGVPGTVEVASSYYIDALFVNQLIQIVGLETMLTSYFANIGVKNIKDRLSLIIEDENIASQLLSRIEDNFQIRDQNINQSILGNIQITLVDYFEKKILKDKAEGKVSAKEIENSIQMFEQALVTPEKLKAMHKDPEKYAMLKESIESFYKIKQNLTDGNIEVINVR